MSATLSLGPDMLTPRIDSNSHPFGTCLSAYRLYHRETGFMNFHKESRPYGQNPWGGTLCKLPQHGPSIFHS